MLSWVQESYERTADARAAVADGLAATARIISAAAAIMIAVAAGFALDPSVMVKIIGIGLASAILVDVTVGRMLLVPAAMALLGARNWYLPRWLGRLLRRTTAAAGAPAGPGNRRLNLRTDHVGSVSRGGREDNKAGGDHDLRRAWAS
jgi:RND superfamily putative drug exporter